ncbi:MAG: hypothetical protein UY48_C0017G0005 [Candidatus Gottesmanbacteria bacterium GW2011_GWB1_49_7]|uniref:Uncharacterized protein n=1 Tax=Candidatus Gottesmanbacteria bacterium GW2011_GWB1_49_7 TaxID=1618448 RepID=A0A0G1Y9C9_9BACT|nr:MAG: hypothetical protein UY48_C0017G0005 [Candidatus Gottesmanbacteria bacterium GW2011_GWB1_49_7]
MLKLIRFLIRHFAPGFHLHRDPRRKNIDIAAENAKINPR